MAHYRVTRPVTLAQDDFQAYLDRLMRMIPGDVVGFYLLGSGFIPTGAHPIVLTVWTVICLVAVAVLRIKYTKNPPNQPGTQWLNVLISSLAFLIWVYTIGGPFQAWNPNLVVPWIGSLLVLVFTFFVPFVYKGD